MAGKKFDPSKFTTNKAKPLPVVLLLDVSASMNEVIDEAGMVRTGEVVYRDGQQWELVNGGKTRINVLNEAVERMIRTLAAEEKLDHEFLVSVITFGASVELHLAPTKASKVAWTPLTASGETPLGEAISMAKDLVEDKKATPSRAYRPLVVLVSDGRPNDSWEAKLESFVKTGRSTKCDRISMAIGSGADEVMLNRFIAGTSNPVFHAEDAEGILDAFERVTMSVTVRSKSSDPNKLPGLLAMPAGSDARSSSGAPPVEEPEDDGYW